MILNILWQNLFVMLSNWCQFEGRIINSQIQNISASKIGIFETFIQIYKEKLAVHKIKLGLLQNITILYGPQVRWDRFGKTLFFSCKIVNTITFIQTGNNLACPDSWPSTNHGLKYRVQPYIGPANEIYFDIKYIHYL